MCTKLNCMRCCTAWDGVARETRSLLSSLLQSQLKDVLQVNFIHCSDADQDWCQYYNEFFTPCKVCLSSSKIFLPPKHFRFTGLAKHFLHTLFGKSFIFKQFVELCQNDKFL